MNPAAWGVIGALVGAIASIAITWIANRHAVTLQRQAVVDERKERHRDFQRKTLIELQDTLHEYHHVITKAYFEDLKSYVKGEIWGRSLLSNEVNDGCLSTGRRTVILMERLSNDELRSHVKELHLLLGETTRVSNKSEAEAKLGEATRKATKVHEELGEELRCQYEHS